MNDLTRYIVAGELLTIMAVICGIWAVYDDHVSRLPRPVKWVCAVVLYVLFGGVSAVVVNALLPTEETSGARLLSAFLAPAVTLGLVALARAVRRPPPPFDPQLAAVHRHAERLAREIEHIHHLDPCPNPDCRAARARLSALIDLPQRP